MPTRPHLTRKRRRERILCAAPGCPERILVGPDTQFPAYCPEHEAVAEDAR